jgi:predicted phosphoribosyltransferase
MEFKEFADDAVILETPPYFRAVADAYRKWYDVSDEEALRLLENAAIGPFALKTNGPDSYN